MYVFPKRSLLRRWETNKSCYKRWLQVFQLGHLFENSKFQYIHTKYWSVSLFVSNSLKSTEVLPSHANTNTKIKIILGMYNKYYKLTTFLAAALTSEAPPASGPLWNLKQIKLGKKIVDFASAHIPNCSNRVIPWLGEHIEFVGTRLSRYWVYTHQLSSGCAHTGHLWN